MQSTRAVVKVILTTPNSREITSSVMSRKDAEQNATAIDKARRKGRDVDLPWLRVSGSHILAVYLEESRDRHRPA